MKRNVIWLLLLLFFAIMVSDVNAYQVADSFSFPLDSYVVGSNCFGRYGLVIAKNWHLGEDATAVAGTNVKTIAKGIVKDARTHTGYGGMYIIEHTLLSGEKLCSIYPHMDYSSFAKKVGDEVAKGEYLGKIGTTSQNGGWPEHLHFGIHKGAYNSVNYLCNGANEWSYAGYTGCISVLDDWCNPTEFINAHKSMTQNVPVKFTDSKTVYYYSNNQLWPILNEAVYTLLGFRKGCTALIPDWNRLVILPATSRSSYSIRSDVVGSPGLPPGRKISYRVNSATCLMGPYDPTKLYALLNDNGQIKFHHITDWDKIYKELGYDMNGRDIVDIPYEFLQSYGEGESIGSSNIYAIVSVTSAYLAYTQVSTLNYSRLLTPPYNLQADTVDNQSIQLTWTLPNGTDDYNIKIYNNGALLNNFSATDSYIISGLSANTTYCFQVSLFCNSTGEESSKSSEVCATTNANPPPPPINWIIEDNRFTTRVDSSNN